MSSFAAEKAMTILLLDNSLDRWDLIVVPLGIHTQPAFTRQISLAEAGHGQDCNLAVNEK